MGFQYTPHTIPLLLSTLIGVIGGVVAWRRRSGPLELWGTLAQFAAAGWAFFMFLTLSLEREIPKLVALLVFLPVGLFACVSFFVFTVYFVGRDEWLTRQRLAFLLSLPVLVLCIAATNSYHSFLFNNIDVQPKNGYQQLQYSFGPGVYATVAAGYVLNSSFLYLLFQKFRRSRNVYRKISLVLFVSLGLLTVGTVFSVLRLSPFPHFLVFPYLYLGLGVLLVAGTTSVRFLRALPVERVLAFGRSREQIPTARAVVMQEIDSGIITLDENGVVVDINTMAKKMIGAKRPVGKHISEVASLDRITSDTTVETVLSPEEPFREFSEEIWVDAGSEERCYSVTTTALTDQQNEGYVILLHDITAQKRREQALRERERELKRQNERLERQTKQLKHQNERLDQFASIVSHDLRNPLNVAKGRLDLVEHTLDQEPDPPFDPEHTEKAVESLDRMEAIIEDALTLARQGKAITETESVPLGELADSSWSNVDTADASLSSPENVTVEGDSRRLQNVFENLFRNAVEHGRADVQVTVGLRENGFYVEDDGPGIPESERDQVFEQGFTTSDEGTGFGLAIVKDVANAHGWEVTVAESADGGARFEFTGVEFPWRKETVVDELDERLESSDAVDVVETAMENAGIERARFDRETAVTILDHVSKQTQTDLRAANAATEVADRLRATTA